MKIRNPKSRYDLKISTNEKVLEVGGGHNPHKRANVVVDKYVDTNYHRYSDIKVLKNQEFLQADGEQLPFADKEFDYVICNQVLEHVDNPLQFLSEQARVAKRGYIETPSLIGEYLFPKKSHRWLVLEIDDKLVLVDKEKYWFSTELDFGYLFLTWLPKTSLAYKLLLETRQDLFTVRHEWKDNIECIVNPDKEQLLNYFTHYWDTEMTAKFFPEKPKVQETIYTIYQMFRVLLRVLVNRM